MSVNILNLNLNLNLRHIPLIAGEVVRALRHFRMFVRRARPKAERVFAEYENFLKLSDPTDRPTVTLFSVLYFLNQATN